MTGPWPCLETGLERPGVLLPMGRRMSISALRCATATSTTPVTPGIRLDLPGLQCLEPKQQTASKRLLPRTGSVHNALSAKRCPLRPEVHGRFWEHAPFRLAPAVGAAACSHRPEAVAWGIGNTGRVSARCATRHQFAFGRASARGGHRLPFTFHRVSRREFEQVRRPMKVRPRSACANPVKMPVAETSAGSSS